MVISVITNLLELDSSDKLNYKIINQVQSKDETINISKAIANKFMRLTLGLKYKILSANDKKVQTLRDKLMLDLFKQKEKQLLNQMVNPLTQTELVFRHCSHLEESILALKQNISSTHYKAIALLKKIQIINNKGRKVSIYNSSKVEVNDYINDCIITDREQDAIDTKRTDGEDT